MPEVASIKADTCRAVGFGVGVWATVVTTLTTPNLWEKTLDLDLDAMHATRKLIR